MSLKSGWRDVCKGSEGQSVVSRNAAENEPWPPEGSRVPVCLWSVGTEPEPEEQDKYTGVWAGPPPFASGEIRVQAGAEVHLEHVLRGLWSRRWQVGPPGSRRVSTADSRLGAGAGWGFMGPLCCVVRPGG